MQQQGEKEWNGDNWPKAEDEADIFVAMISARSFAEFQEARSWDPKIANKVWAKYFTDSEREKWCRIAARFKEIENSLLQSVSWEVFDYLDTIYSVYPKPPKIMARAFRSLSFLVMIHGGALLEQFIENFPHKEEQIKDTWNKLTRS